eukprot:749806-Hanusia_phi.AAC.5
MASPSAVKQHVPLPANSVGLHSSMDKAKYMYATTWKDPIADKSGGSREVEELRRVPQAVEEACDDQTRRQGGRMAGGKCGWLQELQIINTLFIVLEKGERSHLSCSPRMVTENHAVKTTATKEGNTVHHIVVGGGGAAVPLVVRATVRLRTTRQR